jgi:hypothetical protein
MNQGYLRRMSQHVSRFLSSEMVGCYGESKLEKGRRQEAINENPLSEGGFDVPLVRNLRI